MKQLQLEIVLAVLMVLSFAAKVEEFSTAAQVSAEPSAAAPAWAPSMKVAQFTPRGSDTPVDPGADIAEEPFAGSPGAPRAAGAEKAALTSGAHKGLLCSDCHASSSIQPAQGLERPVLTWSTRHTAGLPQYRVYSSKTFDALGTDISQPDGSSRVCVGCHSSGEKVSRQEHRFGPDSMAITHPVSFTYDGGLAARSRRAGLRDPNVTPSGLGSTIARDLLDSRGKMQCSSCHDAHGAGQGEKLVRFRYDKTTSAGSNFCRVCHNK